MLSLHRSSLVARKIRWILHTFLHCSLIILLWHQWTCLPWSAIIFSHFCYFLAAYITLVLIYLKKCPIFCHKFPGSSSYLTLTCPLLWSFLLIPLADIYSSFSQLILQQIYFISSHSFLTVAVVFLLSKTGTWTQLAPVSLSLRKLNKVISIQLLH